MDPDARESVSLFYAATDVTSRRRPIAPKPRVVIDIQHTIYLRQMPTQTPGQLGLTDILIPHSLVQNHFDSSKGWQ